MKMDYPNGYNRGTVWTEEIGSSHGLTKHFLDDIYTCDMGYWRLLCYTKEDEFLLNTPHNVDNNCFYADGMGIKEKEQIFFKLYPNPCSSIIKIESIDASICKIDIIDLFGRIVYSTDFYQTVEIDVSSYPNGFYFVKIKQENKPMYYGKIVINK